MSSLSPLIPLILDVVIAGLLIATIVYAIMLNRRIKSLRDSRDELADLIRGLNDATANAEAGVRGLRKAAGETGENLQRAIDKGGKLAEELRFMIESGESLADRLGAVSVSDRPRGGAGDPSTPVNRAPPPGATRPAAARTPPARPLIDENLIAVARAEAERHAPMPGGRPQRGRPTQPGDGGGAADAARDDGSGEGMSRAERELLQALESRR